MRYTHVVGMSCVALLMSMSACRSAPEPCNCGLAETELSRYTQKYLDVVEDRGNLEQALKACHEQR